MQATVSAPTHRADLSDGMTKANNQEFNFFGNQFLSSREPEYFVYLYNVSETKFTVNRSPVVAEMVLRAKESGEDYKLVGQFPQPLLVPVGNLDSNEIELKPVDARRFAMDICNPDNWGLDQNAVIDPKQGTSGGTNNLGKKGLFWSLNNPPKPEEVKMAVNRMESFYKSKLEEARTVEVSAPAKLSETLSPEHHQAADYFGEQFSWHGKKSKPADCPQCGARIQAGAKFHPIEGGGFCVNDWDAAIKAGVRSRAQAFEATEDPKYAPKAPVEANKAPVEPIKVAGNTVKSTGTSEANTAGTAVKKEAENKV